MRVPWLVAASFLLLTYPTSARQPGFDPGSLSHTYYEAKKCHAEGDWTFCKEAVLQFESVAAPSRSEEAAHVAPAQLEVPAAKEGACHIFFKPAQCKPYTTLADPEGRSGKYKCKDVYWRCEQ